MHAQSDAEWLRSSLIGTMCRGATASIHLRAYALGLEAGRQQAAGTLAITSDAGRIKVPLRVRRHRVSSWIAHSSTWGLVSTVRTSLLRCAF